MQPIDINISNHVEVKLDMVSIEKRQRYLDKAQDVAQRILNARDEGKKSFTVKSIGFNKKLLKRILLDILPEVAFRVCSLIPGILRIVL